MHPVDAAKAVVALFKQLQYPAHQPLLIAAVGIYADRRNIPPDKFLAGLNYGEQRGWFQLSSQAVSMTAEGTRLFEFEPSPKAQRAVSKCALH